MGFPVIGSVFTGVTAYLLRRRLGSLFAVVMAMLGAWLIKLLVFAVMKFFLIYMLLFTEFGAALVEDFSVWLWTMILSFIDGINLDATLPARPAGLFTTNLLRMLALLRLDDIGLLVLYFLLMWIVIKIFLFLLRLVFLGRA